jgi:ferritin-like metal-binding protein YciE
MKLTSLHALYVETLKDLYSAEHQTLRALPKMAKVATSPPLRQVLTDQLHQTQVHVDRLDKMFVRLGVGPKGAACSGMEGLITEGKDLLGDDAQPTVMDAALIVAGRRIGHYLIAGLGSARMLARRLGHANAVALLQEMLDENGAADRKMSDLFDMIVQAPAPIPSAQS